MGRVPDESLAHGAAPEIRHTGNAGAQLAPEALEVLVEKLRRGLKSDRGTVRDTPGRTGIKAEVQENRGAHYGIVPRAVLSVGTPGGHSARTRTIYYGPAVE